MVKIYLNKAFKNHPKGTELDVSPGVLRHLQDLGCVAKPEPEPKPEPVEPEPESEAEPEPEPVKVELKESSKKKSRK